MLFLNLSSVCCSIPYVTRASFALPTRSRVCDAAASPLLTQVVFNCLEALAAVPGDRGLGIVENAVMLGTPVGTKRGRCVAYTFRAFFPLFFLGGGEIFARFFLS